MGTGSTSLLSKVSSAGKGASRVSAESKAGWLKLKTSLKAGLKVCPYRNCGGAEDEPNHNQSTR